MFLIIYLIIWDIFNPLINSIYEDDPSNAELKNDVEVFSETFLIIFYVQSAITIVLASAIGYRLV